VRRFTETLLGCLGRGSDDSFGIYPENPWSSSFEIQLVHSFYHYLLTAIFQAAPCLTYVTFAIYQLNDLNFSVGGAALENFDSSYLNNYSFCLAPIGAFGVVSQRNLVHLRRPPQLLEHCSHRDAACGNLDHLGPYSPHYFDLVDLNVAWIIWSASSSIRFRQ